MAEPRLFLEVLRVAEDFAVVFLGIGFGFLDVAASFCLVLN